MVTHKSYKFIESVLLITLLLTAAYLRLVNITDTPGWYTDETTHVLIARNLVHGQLQYMAIGDSFLLFGRPPLFEFALAGLFQSFGASITVLRVFTACLGVASTLLLYATVRHATRDRWLALISAFILAIYPDALLYSRFGFSYNLLAPLVVTLLWALCLYIRTSKRRFLAIAALVIGIGGLSDIMMFAFIVPLFVVSAGIRWKDSLWSIPLIFLPFAAYALISLVFMPDAFLFDLNYTLSRLGGIPVGQQISTLVNNYTTLLSQGIWIPLGIVGLFLIRDRHLRASALFCLFLPIAIIGRTVALYHLSFYYMIPLLPLIALGVGALLRYGLPYAKQVIADGLMLFIPKQQIQTVIAYVISMTLMGTPLFVSLQSSVQHVENGFSTTIDSFLINPDDARIVAAGINEAITPQIIIIASPAVAWLFDAQVADFQMVVAAQGIETPHLPANIPDSRWAFRPDYQTADFVIIDHLWHNWGIYHIPCLQAIIDDVTTWPIAAQSGQITAYRNPAR